MNSIYRQPIQLIYEIIVVDNGSFDGCDRILRNEFPGVIFVQIKKNIGFGKANNVGFQHSSGRNLLFLNPDTEIIGSALYTMYHYLEQMPDAGVAGCTLLNSDQSIQRCCVLKFPTILNQILDIEYLKVKFPYLKYWGINPLLSNKGIPKEVEVVSGACLMVKRNLFEKIDKFTPEYFMYAEEIDICYKVKKAGYKVYYISVAQVVHYGGGSSKKHDNDLGVVLMRESIFKFFKMRKGKLSATCYRFSMLIASIIRLIMIGALLSLPFKGAQRMRFRSTLTKWKKILRWSVGFDRWASELK